MIYQIKINGIIKKEFFDYEEAVSYAEQVKLGSNVEIVKLKSNMKISIIKSIEPFLLKNGFSKMEPCSYANDLCNVVIQDDCYAVANNQGNVMYSDNHNVYWLVGYLTWLDFIPKNYEK